MALKEKITDFCCNHPKKIAGIILLISLILASQIFKIKIDTDPENMLSEDEFVRVFHNQVKKDFTLFDMVVLGVVNEKHSDGVFNQKTLANIYKLTQSIEAIPGVIENDLLAPSKVDDIRQAGWGTVRFEWLMKEPPQTREGALLIRDRARENPMLDGTLLSEDGKALCLYIPIESKTLSYEVAEKIRGLIKNLEGDERYFITGLPVAEDTFGIEMFKQMAISAPLAGLFIFLLMWWFFKSFPLVVSAMLVAGATVICTMGLMIGMGFRIHIMSSMIPIFLMPIAVVDSIHILSEFFDRYGFYKDRRKTLAHVMKELFNPMIFTSLTSAAGFASLTISPNPPVQIFGVFVAIGIMLAWLFTITLIPAYIMLLKESSLAGFGSATKTTTGRSPLDRILGFTGTWAYKKSKAILITTALVMGVSIWGISMIVVNDNPVKWFEKKHPIRVADRILNQHFAGTYMAYLVLEKKSSETEFNRSIEKLSPDIDLRVQELAEDIPQLGNLKQDVLSLIKEKSAGHVTEKNWSLAEFLKSAEEACLKKADAAEDSIAEAWEEWSLFFNEQRVIHQPFKRPDVLLYIEDLEKTLIATGAVGKVNSLPDVVKKVHYELMEGNKQYNIIPKTSAAVAQVLLAYQNSHDPDDLWHLVTPDYQSANLWVQLKSGDNKDMEPVVQAVEQYIKENPPPVALTHNWAGLTYLNVIWQDKMVHGMLQSLLGSFVVVLIMATLLFRSAFFGILCMVPLSVTITLIYGLIGFAGKDYDMPVAVLSAMTLGLSVDFAIHFLQRSRSAYPRSNRSWEKALTEMFGEPARAISRNILVIAVGFTPLLLSPLIPYQTVGLFLASIMLVSGIATLIILPALIRHAQNSLFREAS